MLDSVVDREKDSQVTDMQREKLQSESEVASRQWCRLRRVSLSAKGWVSW